jgi:hypothetical protein
MDPYYYNILPFDSEYKFLLKCNLRNTQKYNLTNMQFLIRLKNLKLQYI